MGEEFDRGNLFIGCGDGNCITLEEVYKERLSDGTDLNDVDINAVYPCPIGPDAPILLDFSLELDMKKRDHREILKFFKAQVKRIRGLHT